MALSKARARIQRLTLVQELARQKEEAAAKALGQAQQKLTQEISQLSQLQAYRNEYLGMQGGIQKNYRGAQALRNYMAFLASLDNVIEQQQRQVSLHQQRVETLRKQWQLAHARSDNLREFVVRLSRQHEAAQEKQLQSQLDDLSARRLTHDR